MTSFSAFQRWRLQAGIATLTLLVMFLLYCPPNPLEAEVLGLALKALNLEASGHLSIFFHLTNL